MRAALAAAALAVAAEAKKQIELPKTCDEYDASHVIAFGAGCVFTLFVVARRRREQCCAEKRWHDIAARRRGAADDGTISYARRRGAFDANMLPRRAPRGPPAQVGCYNFSLLDKSDPFLFDGELGEAEKTAQALRAKKQC